MSQAQLAAGSDRLPWLTDDATPAPQVAPRGGKRGRLLVGAALALAAIAGGSYWLGTQSWRLQGADAPVASRSTTVPLPPASVPQPQVQIEQAPEVAPSPQRMVRQAQQPQVRITKPEAAATPESDDSDSAGVGPPALEPAGTSAAPPVAPVIAPVKSAPAAAAQGKARTRPAARTAARSAPLTLWPARVSSGAYGRLVQIGAFGSRVQAKRGWTAMVRAYPGVSRLPAVVVEARNSRGRPFYRFQIGTTSQAHSEVLCQRMEKIRFSCAVVGLPQKPKGIER
jgi:hypothetical protein